MVSREGITACLHLLQYDGQQDRIPCPPGQACSDGMDVECGGLQWKNTVMNVFSGR